MNEQVQSNYAISNVQSYQISSEATWEWKPQSRFLVIDHELSDNHDRLDQTLKLLQAEIAQLKGLHHVGVSIIKGSISEALEGDIVIEWVKSADEEDLEKYTIEVGDYVHIHAFTARGFMYAIRTLMYKSLPDKPLSFGVITDFPVMKERALHIDIGRKYFSCEWIKQRIREMSLLRLNTLQLHFSENEGFTFVSERHPEVMSEEYLSRDEIDEILEEARKYHVTIIPSLDSPGHLGHALRTHQEWLLKDKDGNPAKGALDITNPDARAFVIDLIEEYAELFKDSPFFHIGGDEFIDFENFSAYPQLALFAQNTLGIADGEGIDAYIDYINEIATLLENKGFVVRAWNDGLYRSNLIQRVNPKSSIQITYWTKWHANMATVQTVLEKGHEIVNVNDAFFYYVIGENAGYKYPSAERIYELWHPGLFPRINESEGQEFKPPYPRELVGCSFAIWSDAPTAQTEAEVSAGIIKPLLAMAELSWIGEKRYDQFSELQASAAFNVQEG